MRLIQFVSSAGQRRVGVVEPDQNSLRVLAETASVRELALEAARREVPLESLVEQRAGDQRVSYDQLIEERRLLPPLDHPDPSHWYVTGTGLTHLGSAQARDKMHANEDSASAEDSGEKATGESDSMRLFRWGLEGGRPASGQISVQPEWFYKGNGLAVVPPEQPLGVPCFALDGGEEAELAGLYVISDEGHVLRVGFALANEFSDHVMERQNYLYLAHSKLRVCSYGPELRVGPLPDDIQGTVRIVRGASERWAAPFATGEANMSYPIAQLEHHHFKYSMFRQPGDVHCHFFGTATLSFSAGVTAGEGDVFEIQAAEFGRPLRNPLARAEGQESLVPVRAL